MSEELYTISEHGEGEGPQSTAPLALDVKRLISLRLPLMVTVCILCAVPGVLVAWLKPPTVYTAKAQVRFFEVQPSILDDQNRGNSRSYDNFVNTQIGIITSTKLLEKTLDVVNPPNSPLSSFQEGEDPVEVLRSAIAASRQKHGELVTVTCTLPEKDDAKKVLDELIRIYVEDYKSTTSKKGNNRLNALRDEKNTMQETLRIQMGNIADLEKELGITAVGVESPEAVEMSQYRQNLLDLDNKKSDLESVLREQEANVAAVDELMASYRENPDAPINERNVEGRVASDPDVSAYRGLLFAAENDLALIKEKYRPSHPNYAEAEQMVKTRREEMRRYKRKARERVLINMAAEARFILEQARNDVDSVLENIEKYEQEVAALEKQIESKQKDDSRKLSALNQLRQDAEYTQARLKIVDSKMDDIRREEKAPARIELYSAARVSDKPNNKKKIMLVLAALMASACLGVGAGVARELTDHQLRTSKDVARLTHLPVIACIPHADEDEFLQAAHVPLLTMDHPNSMVADEYRRILSRLLYPPEGTTEISSLLIASPSSGDGKTSLACNLGIALSQANRQVLLIDLSSQQPAVEACFGLSAAAGLAEMLRQEETPEQCLRQTEYGGLFVMGPGLRTQDLASRLASRRMTDFLEWAEQEFDHVIIDTPPSLLMSDAKLLAPLTDGVIMVVGVGVSPVGMVRRCLQDMEQLKANVLGVVLNGIRRMRGGYLGNRRRLFYAYYQGMGNGNGDADLPEMKIVDNDEHPEPVVMLLPADENEDKAGRDRNDQA